PPFNCFPIPSPVDPIPVAAQRLCELVHTCVASPHVRLMVGNGLSSTGAYTMQRSFKLASELRRTITVEHLLTRWGFAVQAALALIVIVLLTLTVAALETFLLGDESLSAIEAAMNVG